MKKLEWFFLAVTVVVVVYIGWLMYRDIAGEDLSGIEYFIQKGKYYIERALYLILEKA